MYGLYEVEAEAPEPPLSALPKISLEDRTVVVKQRFRIPDDGPLLTGNGGTIRPDFCQVERITATDSFGSTVEKIFIVLKDSRKSQAAHFNSAGKAGAPLDELPLVFLQMAMEALDGKAEGIDLASETPERDLEPVTPSYPRFSVGISALRMPFKGELREFYDVYIAKDPANDSLFSIYSNRHEHISTPLRRVDGLGREYLAITDDTNSLYDTLISKGLAERFEHNWRGMSVIRSLGELRSVTGYGF